MVRNDWKKLKAMFQAWLVKIAKIAASSTPNALLGDNETKKTTVPRYCLRRGPGHSRQAEREVYLMHIKVDLLRSDDSMAT